jgi:hypothetical protein
MAGGFSQSTVGPRFCTICLSRLSRWMISWSSRSSSHIASGFVFGCKTLVRANRVWRLRRRYSLWNAKPMAPADRAPKNAHSVSPKPAREPIIPIRSSDPPSAK